MFALVSLNNPPPFLIFSTFIRFRFSSKAYGSNVAFRFVANLFSKKFKAVLILTGDHLNSSEEILYEVAIFKLLKMVIFFGSIDVESLLFTFASKELLILIPIPLE